MIGPSRQLRPGGLTRSARSDRLTDLGGQDHSGGISPDGRHHVRSFDQPDETRTPDKTTIRVVPLGGLTAARLTFQPGWRWSECIKPVVGTELCQARHVGTIASGRLHVVHEDGSETEAGPGGGYVIEHGHDAWVL